MLKKIILMNFISKLKFSKALIPVMLFSVIFYSCSSDDDSGPEEIDPNIEAEVLPCDYFKDENKTLVHTPGAEIDYIVECVMKIKNDVTIEPGVRIAFAIDAGFHIDDGGNLTAIGNAENPILLTGVEKVRGFWKGVAFTSPGVRNNLEYVTIEYGGGDNIHSNVEAANLTASYDTRLTVNNCTFRESQNFGMFVNDNTREISVDNSKFTANRVPVYSSNIPKLMAQFNGTNDYKGNDVDVVELRGGRANYGFTSSFTWNKINVPYQVNHDITVTGENTVLTVEPGVHVLMAKGKQFEMSGDTRSMFLGTPSDPIIFEGTDPLPGSWLGFFAGGVINTEMDNMIIKHAGSPDSGRNAAVYIRYGAVISLSNIHFEDIYGCAIKVSGNNNIVTTTNITKTNTNTGNVDTRECIE